VQIPREFARSAAEIHYSTARAGLDQRQQIEERSGPLVAEALVLAGVPAIGRHGAREYRSARLGSKAEVGERALTVEIDDPADGPSAITYSTLGCAQSTELKSPLSQSA
jgi:hypothetical protein